MSSNLPETNDFSIASKLSMVTMGYFQDDYIKYFSPRFKRRSPLINIGYYVRAVVVNEGVNLFLRTVKNIESQVVSLGAGFDTTYFRLVSNNDKINYFEVDFKEVIENKIRLIKNSESLFSNLIGPKEIPFGLLSKNYCLIAQDMGNMKELQKVLHDAGLRLDKPTLFLSECAITYMEEDKSSILIEWGSTFKDVIFLIYEQISPNDGFGQVMMNHFASIGSPLKSLEKYHSKNDQVRRFEICGYKLAWSVGAFEIFKNVLPLSELERILQLEPFDEWEEWHLTSSHYSLSAGCNGIFQHLSPNFLTTFQSNKKPSASLFDWDLVTDTQLQFYGHCALLIWNSSACLVVGGFGPGTGKTHRRLTSFRLIKLPVMEVINIDPPYLEEVTWDCMFHSCTLISDDVNHSEFLLYGGRTSPSHAVNSTPCIVSIRREGEQVHINLKKVGTLGFPVPRRRHTASMCLNDGGPATFILGGIHQEQHAQKILGDAWLLTKDGLWIKQECKPPPRFSHSASCIKDKVYIVGGMNHHFEPLADLWMYSTLDQVWTEVSLNIVPRYSHTSHIFNGALLLVGGVNDLSENQPGLCSINLSDMSVLDYKLPDSTKPTPTMLHNHSSFIYNNTMYIVGGGGNCFSFGTSFNRYVVTIKLNFGN